MTNLEQAINIREFAISNWRKCPKSKDEYLNPTCYCLIGIISKFCTDDDLFNRILGYINNLGFRSIGEYNNAELTTKENIIELLDKVVIELQN